MASYRIEWKRSAKKELRKLPEQARRRILAAVAGLGKDPRPSGCKKLVGGEGAYRIRIGSYRVVYTVFASALCLEIIRVADRKEESSIVNLAAKEHRQSRYSGASEHSR